MTRIFRILVRLAAILFGYAVACAAASLMIALAVSAPIDGAAAHLSEPAMLVRVVLLALLIANAAFAPAAIAILIGEATGRQGWLYYAIAGGITAAIPFAAYLTVPRDWSEFAPLILATGMLAGLVYWLAAGRGAGRWRAPSSSLGQQDPDREG